MTTSEPDLNLWATFDAVAAHVPDRTAIVAGADRWSYRTLHSRSRRLANFLTGSGLGCHTRRVQLAPWQSGQDIVAVLLHNSPEYLEAMMGCYGARAVPANVNYRYVADELVYLLNDAGAKALVYHGRFAPTLAEVLPRLDVEPLLLQVDDDSGQPLLPGATRYEDALAGAPDRKPDPIGGPHEPDDLYILYTGGTTGMPKGTLWRQADLYAAALAGDFRSLGLAEILTRVTEPAAAWLPIAPFMHGAAQWLALSGVVLGKTIVINTTTDRVDPVDVWTLVERERVERLMMVGEAFARPLLDELERGRYDTSSVRLVLTGGAVTSPETKARLLRSVPSASIADVAGASETGGLLTAVSGGGRVAEAGVFKAGRTTVVLDQGLTRVVERGEDHVGWVAKSGRIPLGYLGDEAKTKRTFPTVDGVRYSVPGDRARLRPDGLVELLGRDSVTINSAGEKIFAEEVEQALLRVPGVGDAVVVGRPSERWGQEVVGVVALVDPTVTDDDLIAQITGIARYKLPKAIVRVDAVVRSPAGKADYGWAAQIAAAAART